MAQEEPRDRWKALDKLLRRAEGKGLPGLSVEEVKELCYLYRQVAIDLSRARADKAPPGIINYLNNLAARAHGQVYRTSKMNVRPILMFLITGFPKLVRRHSAVLLFAGAVFLATTLASFVAVVHKPELAYSLFDEEYVEFENIRLQKQEGEYRGNFNMDLSESIIAWVKITTNNIRVSISAFAFGALLGLPCIYLLIFNGRMLGTLEGLVYNHNYFLDFNALILTHGVFELTAICISGGSGFLLARAIILPGNQTRRESLKNISGDAFRLLAGCIAMLVVAGILEAYVTPHFSQKARWTVAISSAVFLVIYFGLVGRSWKSAPASTH